MVLGLKKKNSKYWDLQIAIMFMEKEIYYCTNNGWSPWSDTLSTSSISRNILDLSDLNTLIYKKPPCFAMAKFLNASLIILSPNLGLELSFHHSYTVNLTVDYPYIIYRHAYMQIYNNI